MPRNTGFSTCCLAVALVATTLFLTLYFSGNPWFSRLNLEDGVIEWATVVVLLVASAAAFYSARDHRAKPIRIAVALVFFAFAGEEISWGQRIFMFATPEPLAAINVQSEFTFHNIEGVHGNIRAAAILLLVAAFVVAPLLARRFEVLQGLVARANLPFFDRPGLTVLALAMTLMAIPRALGIPAVLDEFGELLMALAFLVYGRLMIGHEAPLRDGRKALHAAVGSIRAYLSEISRPTHLML